MGKNILRNNGNQYLYGFQQTFFSRDSDPGKKSSQGTSLVSIKITRDFSNSLFCFPMLSNILPMFGICSVPTTKCVYDVPFINFQIIHELSEIRKCIIKSYIIRSQLFCVKCIVLSTADDNCIATTMFKFSSN